MSVLRDDGARAAAAAAGDEEEKHDGEIVAVDGGGPRKKKTAGRQKISMEKIKDKNNLQVTFSKRRQSLFKKASELSILCGAEIAAIVFSPGDNVYSFGSPSVDHVVDRFLDRMPQSAEPTCNNVIRSAEARELQEQLDAANGLLTATQRGDRGGGGGSSNEREYWWDMEPIEEMSVEQLQEFHRRLAAFRNMAAGAWGLHRSAMARRSS